MSDLLARALASAAEEMLPARLPDDLYRRGRDRRRRRVVAGVLAVLLGLAAVPLLWTVDRAPDRPADSPDGFVPERIHRPWPWQAPVQQAPAGRAALLTSGTGGGLDDRWYPGAHGSRIGVVGRDGSYRVLRYTSDDLRVGRDILLSPDGRYVAGTGIRRDPFGLKGSPRQITVVDLVTGATRRFPAAQGDRLIAWRPGSDALLFHRYTQDYCLDPCSAALFLLDLRTGSADDVFDLGHKPFKPMLGAAFTPDGRQLAVQVSTTVSVVDLTVRRAEPRPLVELAPTERLAGTGAFTPDGSRFGLVYLDCADPCTGVDAHRWTLHTRDTATGGPVVEPAFAPIDGSDVRVAGWQRDGTAVVVRSRVDSGVDVLAVPPGGANTPLLRRPDKNIRGLDVASDLILDGRFGGPAPGPGILPVAHWVPVLLVVTVAVGALGYLVVRLRRSARARIRRGPPPPGSAAPPLWEP